MKKCSVKRSINATCKASALDLTPKRFSGDSRLSRTSSKSLARVVNISAMPSKEALSKRSALTTPSGWTKLVETAEFNTSSPLYQRLAIFSKDTVTTSDASASFSFAQASAARMGLLYAVARGVSTITTDPTTRNAVDSWQITPDTLTASTNSSLLLVFASSIVSGGTSISPFNGTVTPGVPASFTLFSGSGLADYRLAGARRAVNSGEGNSGIVNFVVGGDTPTEEGIGDNGLGAITMLLAPAGTPPVNAYASAPGPLGAPAVVARTYTAARASAASPLGSARVVLQHDFTGQIAENQPLAYVMDLQTPGGKVRVPISSWQATLQTEQANYLQCVIPACEPFLDQINAATSFTILRRARLQGGVAIDYEMAAAPAETISIARGTANYTATVSGYSAAIAGNETPPEAANRTLFDIRTIFTQSSGLRVRCGIDWLLRPAQNAIVNGTPFVVAYINYYVSDGDQYMDVGERIVEA